MQPGCNALHKALCEGDELFQNGIHSYSSVDIFQRKHDQICIVFSKVGHTREAALDSQLLVLLSNLGTEQAQHLQTGVVTFEPRMFAEKLVG